MSGQTMRNGSNSRNSSPVRSAGGSAQAPVVRRWGQDTIGNVQTTNGQLTWQRLNADGQVVGSISVAGMRGYAEGLSLYYRLLGDGTNLAWHSASALNRAAAAATTPLSQLDRMQFEAGIRWGWEGAQRGERPPADAGQQGVPAIQFR